MALNAPVFLFYFLPVTLVLFVLLKPKARSYFLFLASLLFYAWGEGFYLLVLLVSWLGNYAFGLRVGPRAGKSAGRGWFRAALVFNLGLLASFKYAAFLLAPLNALLLRAGIAGVETGSLHFPLGISFFTFQALSYIIDVRRGARPAETNPLYVGLYIALFPQIGAGPIIRYHAIADQLRALAVDREKMAHGIRRFIVGLGKKVLLASSMGRVADAVFAVPAPQLTAGVGWLGLACYTLQIYFDFSGYSDMAIGLGGMLGFDYPENFNYPYAARSIRDFWTRWHISLTSFLRDTVFLPVSYAISRRLRQARLWGIKSETWIYNGGMILTMALCGLWHGSQLTFLLWGLYHGLMLSLEQAFLRRRLKKIWGAAANGWTLLLVMLGWVLFRSASPARAWSFFKALAGLGTGDGRAYYPALYLDNRVLLTLAVALLAAWPGVRRLVRRGTAVAAFRPGGFLRIPAAFVVAAAWLALLLLALMVMVGDAYSPFLYTRF